MAEAELYMKCDYAVPEFIDGDLWCSATVAALYQPRVNKDAFWRAVRAREMLDKNYRS